MGDQLDDRATRPEVADSATSDTFLVTGGMPVTADGPSHRECETPLYAVGDIQVLRDLLRWLARRGIDVTAISRISLPETSVDSAAPTTPDDGPPAAGPVPATSRRAPRRQVAR